MHMLEPEFSLAEDFPAVTREQWREVVDRDLQGAPFEKKLVTHTYEGIDIQPVYTAEDWPSDGDPSGFAGLPPFTRGGSAVGPLVGGWDIRQEPIDPDLAAANKAVMAELERGATSLQLRLDQAGRDGLDPDDDAAADLAGRDGLMLYQLTDLDTLLQGAHLEMIGLALDAGRAFLPAAAMTMALWKKHGIDPAQCRGAFNADPLGELARGGELPDSYDATMQRVADLAAFTSANYPNVTAIGVATHPHHNAGATAAQDLAFSMATAVSYLRSLTDAGMDVSAAARQMLFGYSVGCNVFLAIAKLRAARKLWGFVAKQAGVDEEGQAMTMHVRTANRVLTQRDPWVNLLRNTVCTLAAGVADADAVTSAPFDAAIGAPDNFSRRIARNTQIILQEESHLSRVVDPAGGCWFIEKLTDDLVDKAYPIFQDIEKQGGMLDALTSGWVGDQIDSAFAPRMKNIARRRDAVIGVSEFPNLTEKPIVKSDPDYAALRAAAIERTNQRKTTRTDDMGDAIDAKTDKLGDLTGQVVELMQAGASIGEVQAALFKDGDPAQANPLAPHPFAAPFEQLRDASDAYMSLTGHRPKVFLANMGPIAHHTLRAGYATNFFQAGGFEVLTSDGFKEASQAARAFQDSGANIAVICSSDKLYETVVEEVTPKLKAAGARSVVLAGFPGDAEQTYKAAGVDRFIYMKCDVLGTLRELLEEEGVLQ